MTMWQQSAVVPTLRKERLLLCADLEGGCQGTSCKLLLFRLIWTRISQSWAWQPRETLSWLLHDSNWLQRSGLSVEAGTAFRVRESFSRCAAERRLRSIRICFSRRLGTLPVLAACSGRCRDRNQTKQLQSFRSNTTVRRRSRALPKSRVCRELEMNLKGDALPVQARRERAQSRCKRHGFVLWG